MKESNQHFMYTSHLSWEYYLVKYKDELKVFPVEKEVNAVWLVYVV
jgi:hypothetical protein